MSSVKIGSSPAPAPKPSRPSVESRPAVTRPSEPGSRAARTGVFRDEFTRPAGTSKPQVQSAAKAAGATPTLPKELEPFRAQLDSLADKLASDPELIKDDLKLKKAIAEGIKAIPDFPMKFFKEAAEYTYNRVMSPHSSGEEDFG